MKRKSKQFSWPRKLYDKTRIESENKLVSKYGLKNKREIWRTQAKLDYLRTRAKALSAEDEEIRKLFLEKVSKMGLEVHSIADVLALTVEDLLKRRLASIVFRKGFANTAKQARQMIVHKKVLVNDNVVNAPGFMVGKDEEDKISVREKVKKKPVEPVSEETKEEVEEKVEEVAPNAG